MTRIRDPRDFWAGVLFVAAGLAAIALARRHPFGTAASMGPGYFPTVLGGLLVLLGALTAGRSLRPSRPQAAVGAVRVRPVVLVLASVVAFAVALPRLGLLLASLLVVGVSRTAAPGFRWGEVLVFGAALTLFCAAVFVWGLKMPMPLWPAFLGR
ncbi:MAG TPA: tripartite tricarboxylate transporter TctB family protein [Anaeromyxobacteraceae bacterium]|nr:tripartite tricarboxylate transporter TctB family protein [Anaeromyxobacteraceae bacterium]